VKKEATISQIIRKHVPNVRAIYLFGSQADETATAESDVDLAVLVEEKPIGEATFQLKGALSQALRKDVDLIDLYRTDSVTAVQIVVNGKRIYDDGTTWADYFETMALSRYALLNEERAEILEQIKESGTIYG